MNENRAMHETEDDFKGDELMRKLSKPPEFPAASPEQIEATWRAIESRTAEAHKPAAENERRAARSPRWWRAVLPAAPAWSWQLARIAALLIVGFGAAWVAASRGWLPGTTVDDRPAIVSMPDTGSDDRAAPDRAWLAATDYGNRLEALLLGVAKGEATKDVAPVARQVSRDLLQDNRLYERMARRNDDAAVADLLARIEIVLLALATAPEGQEQEVMGMLREFIDESDVLGDLRAVKSTVPKFRRLRPTTAGS